MIALISLRIDNGYAVFPELWDEESAIINGDYPDWWRQEVEETADRLEGDKIYLLSGVERDDRD